MEHSQLNLSSTRHPSPLLGVPVDCGHDSSSGWSNSLLLGLFSQVLTDVGGGVGTFQFRLLPLSFMTGIWLSCLSWFLLGCRRCGRWGLGNGNFRGVKVDTIGGGMVISVGPRYSVKKLAKKKKNRNSALNKKCRMLKCFHFEQIKLDQIPIYAYLHPTIWKTRDTPTHLLTPSSCQGLPLRNTPNKIQLNNYFWLWEKGSSHRKTAVCSLQKPQVTIFRQMSDGHHLVPADVSAYSSKRG